MSRFMLLRQLPVRVARAALVAALALGFANASFATERLAEVRIDFAYYNPVSLLLKEKGWLEESLSKDGVKVRWVQSQGSNKALEFLNGKSIDFGSTAGAAALLARINGNPVKSIYVYSKPEWTALVTQAGSPIESVADLKGKRIAATRGTDPHIFLIRTLAANGLTEREVKVVLLQHQDGRLALAKGDVDAWAGLDPLMAQAELDDHVRIFYRNAGINTWGVLNTREDFAADHPDVVLKVIQAYEKARAFALANPDALKKTIVDQAKLSEAVAALQLERTSLATAAIGEVQKKTIEGAGLALQQAGVVAADVNVPAVAAALIEPSFVAQLGVR
jgi:sulfonate transport system substrate-binding protein